MKSYETKRDDPVFIATTELNRRTLNKTVDEFIESAWPGLKSVVGDDLTAQYAEIIAFFETGHQSGKLYTIAEMIQIAAIAYQRLGVLTDEMEKTASLNIKFPVVCPVCNTTLDGHVSINDGEDIEPEPGNYTVCFTCDTLLQFDNDLKLVKLDITAVPAPIQNFYTQYLVTKMLIPRP